MSDRTAQDNEPAATPDSLAGATADDAAAADMASGPAFLSAREAAIVLGVSERTVRRAIQKGEIHAFKHAGAYQISPAALETFRQRETGQSRAMQLQERLAALEAGPIVVPESTEPADAP
jgi:excisionase family DNA binding protein